MVGKIDIQIFLFAVTRVRRRLRIRRAGPVSHLPVIPFLANARHDSSLEV